MGKGTRKNEIHRRRHRKKKREKLRRKGLLASEGAGKSSS
jgi:hypothetical protein